MSIRKHFVPIQIVTSIMLLILIPSVAYTSEFLEDFFGPMPVRFLETMFENPPDISENSESRLYRFPLAEGEYGFQEGIVEVEQNIASSEFRRYTFELPPTYENALFFFNRINERGYQATSSLVSHMLDKRDYLEFMPERFSGEYYYIVLRLKEDKITYSIQFYSEEVN